MEEIGILRDTIKGKRTKEVRNIRENQDAYDEKGRKKKNAVTTPHVERRATQRGTT